MNSHTKIISSLGEIEVEAIKVAMLTMHRPEASSELDGFMRTRQSLRDLVNVNEFRTDWDWDDSDIIQLDSPALAEAFQRCFGVRPYPALSLHLCGPVWNIEQGVSPVEVTTYTIDSLIEAAEAWDAATRAQGTEGFADDAAREAQANWAIVRHMLDRVIRRFSTTADEVRFDEAQG